MKLAYFLMKVENIMYYTCKLKRFSLARLILSPFYHCITLWAFLSVHL